MWTIMFEPKNMDASTFRSQKLTMSKEDLTLMFEIWQIYYVK